MAPTEEELVKQYDEAKTPEEKLAVEKQLITQSDNRPTDEDPPQLPDSHPDWGVNNWELPS